MRMSRRHLLRSAGAVCACCAAPNALLASDPRGEQAPHWSYDGATGPAHWGELQPDFKVCQLGLEQTPVDLKGGIKADIGALDVDYRPLPLRIQNNGHTIQVNADAGAHVTLGSVRYELTQFHFHHPSEHLLSGTAFPMELHLVHRAPSGALAVIGVFLSIGAHNRALAPVFDALPAQQGPEVRTGAMVDIAALLPTSGGAFRYIGSLTTPPCAEGLTWTVFKQPLEISEQQVRRFAALFANNARPVQSVNRRFLIETN